MTDNARFMLKENDMVPLSNSSAGLCFLAEENYRAGCIC